MQSMRSGCIHRWHWWGAAAMVVCAVGLPAPALCDDFDVARANAKVAAEVLSRCNRFIHGWLQHADARTGLIPQNLRGQATSPVWTAENSAADLWPFMVLSAYYTDEALLEGKMRDILHAEIRRTTRLGHLPDAFDFGKQAFLRDEVNEGRLIFGASEYCKDGLLPIVELMGRGEWFARLRDIATDICGQASVHTDFGPILATSAEVNGEMLQVLARLYPATGDTRFLATALRIADAYFLEMLPNSNWLPCHDWDFDKHAVKSDRLRLRDHGSEIVGGLSEAYALARRYAPARADRYEPAFRSMLDTLLERARNEDGLWVDEITPSTLETPRRSVPDTWGYVFNAFYTAYLLTGEQRYRDAVVKGLESIHNYPDWGGADAFADSIESGIVLLNREPVASAFKWVDEAIVAMSAKQQEDGIIEGWHGDGNVARTWLMYAMMKTGGLRAAPWREDLAYGAERDGDNLRIYLTAKEPWTGKLFFDYPRHREHFGVSPNYPRLNEYAEWFSVEDSVLYRISVPGAEPSDRLGAELRRGLAVSLQAGQEWTATVAKIGGPPYGPHTK